MKHFKTLHSVPYLIGITGGIGSGKSTFAKYMEKNGLAVYYSDTKAKEIVQESSEVKDKIITLLGKTAYDENGKYNREWVSSQVFGNEALLLQLNAIIHPAVKMDFKRWMAAQKAPVVFKESALLYELNLDRECYQTVLVTADENIRIRRVMERDHKSYEEIKHIMARQMPEEEKVKRADFVVYNNLSKQDLEIQSEIVLKKIMAQLPTQIT